MLQKSLWICGRLVIFTACLSGSRWQCERLIATRHFYLHINYGKNHTRQRTWIHWANFTPLIKSDQKKKKNCCVNSKAKGVWMCAAVVAIINCSGAKKKKKMSYHHNKQNCTHILRDGCHGKVHWRCTYTVNVISVMITNCSLIKIFPKLHNSQ